MSDPEFTTAYEFPCDFPLKVIGRATDDFEDFAVSIVRKHVPEVDMGAVVSRSSRRGKYQAVTINFTAQSRPQLEALYLELGQSSRILMAL
jgi:putative lipoic acid-binding regulatory protein